MNNELTPKLSLSYEVFEHVLRMRTGTLPEGVRRYLKVAYYSGAAGMLSASKLIAFLPTDLQQPAMDAVAAEITEVLE